MRFVSTHARYSFQAQGLEYTIVSTPQGAVKMPTQQMILCDFQQGGLSPWEQEVALEHLEIKGMPDQDTVPKGNRLSVFDTEAWQLTSGADDDTREFVERRFLTSPDYGIDFIAIDKPKRKPPWPRYDELADEKMILNLVDGLGYSAYDVISYEQENRKRPDLLVELQRRADAGPLPEGEEKPAPLRPEEFVQA